MICTGIDPVQYESRLRESWVWKELQSVRNVKPAFHKFGLYGGMMYTGLFYVVGRGKEPWYALVVFTFFEFLTLICYIRTLKHDHTDHGSTEPTEKHKPIDYPKPDGKLTFDILSSVALSG